jgi:hypothetical protein
VIKSEFRQGQKRALVDADDPNVPDESPSKSPRESANENDVECALDGEADANTMSRSSSEEVGDLENSDPQTTLLSQQNSESVTAKAPQRLLRTRSGIATTSRSTTRGGR